MESPAVERNAAAEADSLGLRTGRDKRDVAHSEAIAEESDTPLKGGTMLTAVAREGLEGLGAECNGARSEATPGKPDRRRLRDTSTLPTRCRCRRGTRPKEIKHIETKSQTEAQE